MSFDPQRLFELLPAIYRIRDVEVAARLSGLLEPAEETELASLRSSTSLLPADQKRLQELEEKRQRGPLKSLLSVIAGQIAVLEEDLDQLYDDQFIETCAEWVVPYIGDLIGYRPLHNVMPKVGNQRAEVAHTIGFRRRKGTATMLEQLARDVTGWNARVVEFFQLLGWTQYMNHIRSTSFYAPDLREWEALEKLNTPFDTIAHTVDVRRIGTGRGKYNIPNIGIFLWRLNAMSLTKSPAVPAGDTHRFRFDPLERDTQLFTRPEPEDEIFHLAEPINVPGEISRRVLHEKLEEYYGPERSIFLEGVDIKVVEACNLADMPDGSWAHVPASGRIAIDPVLGRIAFGDPQSEAPRVTFHYAFSADMGGGEYDRPLNPVQPPTLLVTVPSSQPTIQAALNEVAAGGVVEISDTGRYEETLRIAADANQRIELRASNNHRPTVVLVEGDLEIEGGDQSEVTIDGLLISSGAIRIGATPGNQLKRLRLRHCTLVPNPLASLIVEITDVTVEIDSCILGGLRIAEGSHVQITGSIIDATSETGVAFAHPGDDISAGGTLVVIDTTIIGKVHTREMQLASNSIFMANLPEEDPWHGSVGAPIRSEKRQTGCVRFSHVPWLSVVPRRFRCRPASEAEILRMRPQFTSLRYGDPGYCQLARRTALEIRTGADDEAEMGAFHKLYQPQRKTNLQVRLDEYLRFGLEAAIFYVT